MKLLYLFYQYPLYLKGCYFQEFLNQLAKNVNHIYLISYHFPKNNFKKPKNITIFWLPRINLSYLDEILFMLLALVKVILTSELKQINFVNSVGPRGLLAGWYLKKRHNIPLICTIEMLNKKNSLINKTIYYLTKLLLIYSPIDRYLCWSKYYWQNHLKKWGINKNKVKIIPAGINIKNYHPNINGVKIKQKYSPNNPLIVFAKPLYDQNTKGRQALGPINCFIKKK